MKKIIVGIVAVLLIGILAFFGKNLINPETKMNQGYVNGNTAGNLYNGGLFCEYNGVIYFSNPSDGGKLYSMDAEGKNLKKLTNDNATYINVDDNYIYYIRNNSGANLDFNFVAFHRNALVRVDHNGNNLVILDTEPCLYASLIGNYIYYIHYDELNASTLYKVRIDGEEQQQVSKEAVYTCNADGQFFYYNGMSNDGSIHRYDTVSDTSIIVYAGNTFQPIVKDGVDVYYIDGDTDCSIVHTNINFDNPTFITHDSVDAYNVHGSTIYYQRFDKNGNSALCMIKNDGTGFEEIRKGDFCDIHVTSYFVFFRDFHTKEIYYFSRSNPYLIEKFEPGTVK